MRQVLLLLIAFGGMAFANSRNIFFVTCENQSDVNVLVAGCENQVKQHRVGGLTAYFESQTDSGFFYFVRNRGGAGLELLDFFNVNRGGIKSERDKTYVFSLSNLT
ncbi:hypothetical protein G5B10_06090 [Fluviicola sp. SGL-29]|nr:hypothetical protein [Fluviicola sp. SGL-29]